MPVKGVKQLHAYTSKSSGNPEAAQLSVINSIALAPMTEDQVYVRTAILAHSGIDRDQDSFEKALLDNFAASLPGKGLFVKHPGGWDGDSGPGVGRWFEATVKSVSIDEARTLLREPGLQFLKTAEQAYLLEASYFIPRSNKNADLIADIDAGIASDVSIGFRATSRVAVEKGADDSVTAWQVMAPGEAMEGSLVWLGAQPGARTVKDAGQQSLFNNEQTEEEPTMAMTDAERKELNDAKNATTQALNELKAAQAKAEAHDEIMKAAGEGVGADQVIAYIAAGTAYAKQLKDDLLRLERLQGVVGDSEEDAKAAQAVYGGMSIDTLAARAKALAAKFPGGSQMDGGDPNASEAEQDGGKKGLRDKSVTAKAMSKAA